MRMRALPVVSLLLVLNVTSLKAQMNCQSAQNSSKMICAVPQVYSTDSLPSNLAATPVLNNFALDQNGIALHATVSAVGTELANLQLASPASGIVFTFDRSLGVVMRSAESYGPILGERAESMGRHRLFVAATYQFFSFGSLDGVNLKRLPGVYTHVDSLNPDGTPRSASQPPSPLSPAPEQDFITTSTRVDLKVHQITFYATYGLTSRIDVSAAVPVLDVRMGITSDAHIVRVAPQPVAPGSPFFAQSTAGFFNFFNPNDPANSLDASFVWSNNARGIGDVILRAKGTVLKRERAAAAVGTEVRLPSGDEKNFLGSGAAGIKPFAMASYAARVSPHVNIGYQFNGSSILAGSPLGTKARLADEFFYTGGFDVGITKKVTGAVDLVGERLFSANRVALSSFVDTLGNSHPQLALTHGSFNMNDLALGAKYSPFGNFLLTANLEVQLDNGGLRSKLVPLIGAAYVF